MASTHRSRSFAAALVAGVSLVVASVVPAAAEPPPASATGTPPATPPPSNAHIASKQADVERTRLEAAAATTAYTDAAHDLAILEEDIAVRERRIPELESRIEALKALLAQRAAVLYRGGEQPGLAVLGALSSTGDLLQGGRSAASRQRCAGRYRRADAGARGREGPARDRSRRDA